MSASGNFPAVVSAATAITFARSMSGARPAASATVVSGCRAWQSVHPATIKSVNAIQNVKSLLIFIIFCILLIYLPFRPRALRMASGQSPYTATL